MKTGEKENPMPRKRKKQPSFTYEIEKYISLPVVNKDLPIPLDKLLSLRKSKKEFKEIDTNQLSNLLWYSAKVKKVAVSENGQILTYRNSPSAGAIHPIDIFISLPDEISKRSLLYYNPFTHKLGLMSFQKKKLKQFFEGVNQNIDISNATVIWFVADISRTSAKYLNPQSLVWRDAGSLLLLFQFVATALNLNSCPVGTLGYPDFKYMFSKYKNITSAGGIIVG